MNIEVAIEAGIVTKFVYDNWNATSNATDLKDRVIPVQAKSYKVLNTVYANDLATNKSIGLQHFVTIGVVAVNEADPTDVVIALRGTSDILDWLQDLKFLQTPFPNVLSAGNTEDGFTAMYLSFSLEPAAGEPFLQQLTTLKLDPKATVTVTGHSLGAALATLLALDLAAHSDQPVVLYTHASPRVGDLSFMHLFNNIVPRAYRIHNRLDVVTKTPPPLFYFHVGDDTELIPTDIKFDLLCEHELTSYLHMLALLGGVPGFELPAACAKP
jgi:triacylglycerol lipase